MLDTFDSISITSPEAMRRTFDAITGNPARALHFEDYGLAKEELHQHVRAPEGIPMAVTRAF